MNQVSPLRLWVMRAMYLLLAAGIGVNFWPRILSHDPAMPHMTGVAIVLIGTVGLLALLGLRYPLQMIPILLFELAWKAIWILAYGLPQWSAGRYPPTFAEDSFNIAFGAVLLFVIPWGYVWRHYVQRPGARWR